MNQMTTKSPIAAAMLEMIRARLATPSTLMRLPGEKPNTLVSTLSCDVRLRCKNTKEKVLARRWKVTRITNERSCMAQKRTCLLMLQYSTTRVLAS